MGKDDDGFCEKAKYFCSCIGGWERWFQMELVYYIFTLYGDNYSIKLEDNSVYSGTSVYRADLTLTHKARSNAKTIVELKCQVASSTPSAFARLVEQDIKKASLAAKGWDYEVIAITQGPREMEAVMNYLCPLYPNQISGREFDYLSAPGAFIHFFRGAM